MTWGQWLILIGNAFQLLGVGVVAVNILGARRAWEKHKADRDDILLQQVMSIVRVRRVGSASVSGGSPPSVEQRVEATEARQAELRQELDTLRAGLRQEIEQVTINLEDRTSTALAETRKKLEDPLGKAVGRGLVGAAVVGVGLVIQTIGSLKS